MEYQYHASCEVMLSMWDIYGLLIHQGNPKCPWYMTDARIIDWVEQFAYARELERFQKFRDDLDTLDRRALADQIYQDRHRRWYRAAMSGLTRLQSPLG